MINYSIDINIFDLRSAQIFLRVRYKSSLEHNFEKFLLIIDVLAKYGKI